MPYKIIDNPTGRGFFVITKETGRRHSKEALPKSRADSQMRALYRVVSLEDRKYK
jgi:hypothetical protein